MFRAQKKKTRLHTGLTRGLALLLCSLMLIISFQFGDSLIFAEAADNETVTVTVNYVYESNQAMVAQPYTAQIMKGSAFKKTLEVPKLVNYSIPTDLATGLSDRIVLSRDEAAGVYSLAFDLSSVDEDITVNLYYKAGTAKYMVYHYFQNLEDDNYDDAPPTVVELQGDIDAYTQAVAESKPGFHCKGVPQTTIAADGTTKVEIYYDRDYYTVTFDVNGGIDGPEPIFAKYGTIFEANTIKEPSRKGYVFLGWQPTLSDTETVTGNVTYVAQWQPEVGQADYTIVLWGQNANDDEYSYLSSHEAWGNVGNLVTWNESTLISHVHTDECKELSCDKDEHTHSEECYTCGKEEHTHDNSCCSLTEHTHGVSGYPGAKDYTAPLIYTPSNPAQGQIYIRNGMFGTVKGIYIGNNWYGYDGDAASGSVVTPTCSKTEHAHGVGCVYDKCGLEEHTHSDACASCGKSEHTHTEECYSCDIPVTPVQHMSDIKPNAELWQYDHSDTVTVDANGSTVMNVYFTRTVFTLQFRKQKSNKNDYGEISARWGKNIATEYNAIVKKAGSSFWSTSRDASGPYTNYIGVMPTYSKTYYNKAQSGQNSTMYYYAQNLNGDYEEIFRISLGGYYYVSDEDRYEFEGFTCDLDASAKNGASCNGAKFYYKRNGYSLEFYSESNSEPDKTETPQYQENLGGYYYEPTNRPPTVEPDAIFVGWYQNPECTGEKFDLSLHTMPANNIALYAKWVNGLYKVRTFTDETFETPYTCEGYDGEEKNIEKYTLATEPKAPEKDGYVFVGWFYKDGDSEKPFSFTMPITKDYDLYPKFSEPKAVEYTVHYYIEGTTEKIADDRTNSVMIGTTVTEKAKMGTELNLLPEDKQKKYYPTNTSTSVIINKVDQEIIFYYTEASSVEYTVYYQDEDGKDLIDPVTKTTEYSTVTEQYVPIENYAPRQFSITMDLSSDASLNTIVFVYDPTLTTLTLQKSGWETIDENQTFLFNVKGKDDVTKDIDLTVTIHGNGKTTITDLPVGTYTVTEVGGWSWRYTASSGASQEITVGAQGAVLTITNYRTNEKWLGGDSFKINLFGSGK